MTNAERDAFRRVALSWQQVDGLKEGDTALDDDHPLYAGYLYIAEFHSGGFWAFESNLHDYTASAVRRMGGLKGLYRFDWGWDMSERTKEV